MTFSLFGPDSFILRSKQYLNKDFLQLNNHLRAECCLCCYTMVFIIDYCLRTNLVYGCHLSLYLKSNFLSLMTKEQAF